MSNLVFSEGINIYNSFKPASRNIFEILIYDINNEGANMEDELSEEDKKSISSKAIHNYARFHATSIKIGDEYLSLKRNPISKQFQVDGNESYAWADKLTIKWRESSDWEVRRYHETWIGTIYDKEKDVYKALDRTNPLANPYRTIVINLPGKYSLKCEGVLPKNIGNIDLAWGRGSSTVEPQLEYYVTRINKVTENGNFK